jgi:DNA-directed RNA polymerase specialized sigma subunit
MYRKKSDYALNKLDPDAIVYLDANGEIHRLTREDFDSEEEFLRWKKWSDENYHVDEKKETIDSQHTVPLSAVSEMKAASPSEEARSEKSDAESARKEAMKNLLSEIRDLLSEKQFRRLWMWRVDRLSEEEIAAREGITQQGVSKCIANALKIICEHFKE